MFSHRSDGFFAAPVGFKTELGHIFTKFITYRLRMIERGRNENKKIKNIYIRRYNLPVNDIAQRLAERIDNFTLLKKKKKNYDTRTYAREFTFHILR